MARAMLKNTIWCARNAGGESSNSCIMVVHLKQADKRIAANAFTLAEILITIVFLVLVMAGMIYGYVQMNRTALWSSMSLAAQSVASQGAEQARCAKWDTQCWPPGLTGPGTCDELGTNSFIQSGSNYTLDIPVSGAPIYITNYVSITQISDTPKLRQIRSACVWRFPLTGDYFTNTVITLRAPDQ